MRAHLIRFVINALALCLAVWLVPGLAYTGTPVGFLVLAAVFGLVNAILRPLLMATGAVSRHLGLGFTVSGFWAALLGGIIVGLASTVLALTIKERTSR